MLLVYYLLIFGYFFFNLAFLSFGIFSLIHRFSHLQLLFDDAIENGLGSSGQGLRDFRLLFYRGRLSSFEFQRVLFIVFFYLLDAKFGLPMNQLQ